VSANRGWAIVLALFSAFGAIDGLGLAAAGVGDAGS